MLFHQYLREEIGNLCLIVSTVQLVEGSARLGKSAALRKCLKWFEWKYSKNAFNMLNVCDTIVYCRALDHLLQNFALSDDTAMPKFEGVLHDRMGDPV